MALGSRPVVRTETESGRARLLAVLLVDALQTLGRARRGESAREVRGWVCAGEDDGPFSFTTTCDALGLPAARLRRRLGLRAAQVRDRPPGRGTSRRPSGAPRG